MVFVVLHCEVGEGVPLIPEQAVLYFHSMPEESR